MIRHHLTNNNVKNGAFALSLILTACLAACGGAGAPGGTTSGTMSNKIDIASTTIVAGSNVAIASTAAMRGTTPAAMSWSVAPLFSMPSGSSPVMLNDAGCSAATYTPPPFSTSSGRGYCKTVITTNASTAPGTYRISSTASNSTGSVTDSVDLVVEGVPAGGFRLVESSNAVVGTVGSTTSLEIPFTATPGANISNVKYAWTAAAGNPSSVLIAGSSNSKASFIANTAGQYLFNVTATAMVNGVQQSSTASVVVVIQPIAASNGGDSVSVSQPQIVKPGSIVTLNAAPGKPETSASYTYAWTQLSQADGGGPELVKVLSSGGSSISFVAPDTLGAYGFQVDMTKTNSSGSAKSSSRTSVIVERATQPVFTVNAGAVKTVAAGTPVILSGSVAAQGAVDPDVVYSYSWYQSSPSAASVLLANSKSANASFLPTVPGLYTFDLIVYAKSPSGTTMVDSATQVTVTPNAALAPLSIALAANAGPVQTATKNSVVKLNGTQVAQGTGAKDAIYTYSWQQNGITPAAVTLTGSNTSTPSFYPTVDGVYSFTYGVIATLADGTTRSSTSDTQVIVGAAPVTPVSFGLSASAGAVQTGAKNSVVKLTGTQVPQGTTAGVLYDYLWTQTSGPSVTISNSKSSNASFYPTVDGIYGFTYRVIGTTPDGVNHGATADTQVIVAADATPTTTFALTANAGEAQMAPVGTVVKLSGTQQAQGTDKDVLYSYMWSQVGATPAVATISNAGSQSATFVPTVEGTYGFTYQITATRSNGTTQIASSDTQVVVGTGGGTYTLSAGDAQAAVAGTPVTMTGVVSTQGAYSNAQYTYAWTQVGASPAAATISNAGSLTSSFVPTTPGTYTFLLTVTAVKNGVTTVRTAQTQVLVN